MTTPRVTVPVDTFSGDNAALVASISALLETPDASLSARVPGMTKQLLASAAARLSAAPAPEGGAVKRACVVFQEAIDDFEADVADVMAEGSERADLWDREITVNIDALKTVMSAALATREDAQPVAWLETNRENGEQRATVRQPSDTPTMRKRWTYTPLYTHPAPDALRVAVEALERAKRDLHRWRLAIPTEHMSDDSQSFFEDDVASIDQALAALQAEQGAK